MHIVRTTPIQGTRHPRGEAVVGASILFIVLCTAATPLPGQAVAVVDSARGQAAGPVQDNSFLIEEAYNQERGVVQHIFTFQRAERGAASTFLFSQEWPVRSVRHQLSYSLPLERAESSAGSGLGDARVNYRYQLLGDGDARVALAPRLTVVLPTGDYRRGRGAGATGVEAWLPLSLALSTRLVAHANLGTTVTPNARNAGGVRATTRDYAAGASVVWLARRRVNFLLEGLYQRNEEILNSGARSPVNQLTISPGIRWAYNFVSGLQIVPGVAVPLGAGPSHGARSVLLYLSLEHPFGARASR